MSDASELLKELKNISAKTAKILEYNKAMLDKLTGIAMSPAMESFDKHKKSTIYATIGVASMRILKMKALLESQKSNSIKVRIIEFFAVPLTIIKKILGISDDAYHDASKE